MSVDAVLDSNLDFNLIIFVVSKLSSDANFYELGDKLLSGDDSDLLARVVRAMVTVNVMAWH